VHGGYAATLLDTVMGCAVHSRLHAPMIEGKGVNELKKYRSELISRGIAAGEIPDEAFFGHHLFCVKDPDGNGIKIYTSHSIY
jgi:hypothetical protein